MTELDTIGDSLMTKHGFDLLEVRKLAVENLKAKTANKPRISLKK